jgi:hypothetical protein
MNSLEWFVLRVKPKHEKKVTQLLLELNFQAYNPIVKVKRKWSDRIKTIELPAIPGMIFIKTNLIHKNKIFCSSSIKGWLYENNSPVNVRESEIEALKIGLESKDWISNSKTVQAGDYLLLEELGINTIVSKTGLNTVWAEVLKTNIIIKLKNRAV